MSYTSLIVMALALCACVAVISATAGHGGYGHGGGGYGGGGHGGGGHGGGYGGGHGGGGYDDGYGSHKYGYYGPYGNSYVHVAVDGWKENSNYGFKAGGY